MDYKIEIYGLPEDVFMCPACMKTVNLCKKNNLEYTFIPLINGIHRGKVNINQDNYNQLLQRTGWTKEKKIINPVVFINDILVGGLSDFRVFIRDVFTTEQ